MDKRQSNLWLPTGETVHVTIFAVQVPELFGCRVGVNLVVCQRLTLCRNTAEGTKLALFRRKRERAPKALRLLKASYALETKMHWIRQIIDHNQNLRGHKYRITVICILDLKNRSWLRKKGIADRLRNNRRKGYIHAAPLPVDQLLEFKRTAARCPLPAEQATHIHHTLTCRTTKSNHDQSISAILVAVIIFIVASPIEYQPSFTQIIHG